MSAFSRLTRRSFCQGLSTAALTLAAPRAAFAAVPADTPLHGLSAFGDLRYPPDYDAFDYANVDAPQGGRLAMSVPNWTLNQSALTFDTFNTFVLQGSAPPRIETLYDGLMTASLDEPDSLYCALARSISMSPDRNVFTFKLRPEARFSTGAGVTATDVVFSYKSFKEKGHPGLSLALQELSEAVADDPETVRLIFSGRQSFFEVLGAFGFAIVPADWFAERDFSKGDLVPIPGSGPYSIGRFSAGNFIEYEKRPDYWAKDLAFARGLNHFQTLRIDFFRDRQAGLENFKKGDTQFRQEFTSKSWATEYSFPAVAAGHVIKRTFPRELAPTFQCWALNQRRARFADVRVRQAINLCFDFAWTNANMFFNLYKHSDSCFEGSPFKATDMPDAAELALLEPLRSQVPEAVFGPAWTQEASDGSGSDRKRLRAAYELFAAAGWTRRGDALVDAAGEVFQLEFLLDDPGFERVYGKFIETARRIGVDARFRIVDAAQYQDRQNGFDFDMIGLAYSPGATPTKDTLTGLFGSEARDRPGTNNYPGMADAAVDSLIASAAAAKDREALNVAMRCLDRVLRANLHWIPNIHSSEHRVAYWDMFGFKEPKPDYGFPVEQLWWFDKEKAAAIGRA